jgi:putative transposase
LSGFLKFPDKINECIQSLKLARFLNKKLLMPRKKVIINPIDPCHIGARSNNKDWFSIPMEEVWSIMGRYLYLLNFSFAVQIHSFVLMSNHFHLIATFPESNTPQAMRYFMRETSRSIAKASDRINHVYGGNHFCSQIKSYNHYCNVYKYVYRNPVEAKIILRAEEYPYSSLSGLLGFSKLIFPVAEDEILFNGQIEKEIEWLNTPNNEDYRLAIKRALRKSQFEHPKTNNGVDPHPLDFERY